MILKHYRILFNSISFILIQVFLINCLPNSCVRAAEISSTLSPQIAIEQNDFSWAARSLIIDSYISDSLLTEFEYRSLGLDVIFNTRLNPRVIEQKVMQLVSKDDLLSYFSDIPYDQKRIKTRLKVRDIFNAVLDQYGYKPFTLSEYQDKIMEKILESHNRQLDQSGGYVLLTRIWKAVQGLTADEILLFAAVPSSPEQHALKKKIKTLVSPGLIDEGIVFDEKVWASIAERIQVRRSAMLEYFYFYTNKYDKEFKQRLLNEFSLRDIAYYSADTAGFSYERQQARTEIYRFFMSMLAELDSRIKQNPYTIKLSVYNQGRHWQSRYNAVLDRIIREMLEIDVDSYELSVKKMLGQRIDKNSIKSVRRAINIIVDAEKKLLTLKPADYDLYHRIRAHNGMFENNFVYIDEGAVLYEGQSVGGRQMFVSENIYLIDQGSSVLYQTVDPKTGENEVFIFSQQAPYVEVKKIKNDYSKMFKDDLKGFIAENFSLDQARELIAYLTGTPEDWQKAYDLSLDLNSKCEQFFWRKFRMKVNKDGWRAIFGVMQEYVQGKSSLTAAEAEFISMSLPFSPRFNGIMRLTKRDYGILPLSRGRLFEQRIGQLQSGQSI